jgi:signal transduction histidine kinase
MPEQILFERYREMQAYVGWGPADEDRIARIAPRLRTSFPAIIEDFYEEIARHPAAVKVIRGGKAQIDRLKETLQLWLDDLFFCAKDADYVERRWRIGLRHVRIGLDQIYVNAAMARIRCGVLDAHARHCAETIDEALANRVSINRLIDLELAIVQDAYQAEYLAWHNREERQRLLRAERLAAIGETMAGLVHESRNALQRTRACLEMLALDLEDRPDSLELVERVQAAQSDLHQLFEEVREYAAPLNLHLSHCDLSAKWRQAWGELSHLHEPKGLSLVEPPNDNSRHCVCDRFAVTQAFRNILENAIQASPQGGKVSVHCRETTRDGQREVQITIRDEGPGIDAALREQVGKPFFTTKTKGTGLGLAISTRIMESHGGRLEVGDPPSGAEIRVFLPRVDAEELS